MGLSKKRELVSCTVIFKHNAWTVKVEDSVLGRADSLIKATDLLYTNGYKVYAYRRGTTSAGKMKFTADCLPFDYAKEHESV